MASYLSPGIYPKETDFSFYVKQISTSVAAMVGVAEKGPINTPVLVTSWEQFTRSFGAYIAESYLAYGARAFFDNGGSVLWVVRIAHYTTITDKTTLTAKASTAKVQDTAATPADLFSCTAVNESVWGDAISVTISANEDDAVNLFDLAISRKGTQLEIFRGLSRWIPLTRTIWSRRSMSVLRTFW